MDIKRFYEKEHQQIDKSGNKLLKFSERGFRLYQVAGRPKGKKILDIGCQFEDVTKHFVPDNDVTIVDFNSNAVKYMKEVYRVKGIPADIDGKKLKFKSNTFDVVVCAEVIEHLFFYEELIEEISRVLKPGGIFVGSTPNAFNIRARIGFLLNRPGKAFNHEHIRYFNETVLRRIFRKYFRKVHMDGFQGMFKYISLSLFAHIFLWRCTK